MSVKVATLIARRAEHGLSKKLWKLEVKPEFLFLGSAIRDGIPWVLPHRGVGAPIHRPLRMDENTTKKPIGNVVWEAPSALTYLLDWYGTDEVRANRDLIRGALYDCGVSRPRISNAEELLRIFLSNGDIYIYRDDISYGEMFDDLMWEIEDEGVTRAVLTEGKNKGTPVTFLPLRFYVKMIREIGTLASLISFGFPKDAFHDGARAISQVQVDFWPSIEDGESISVHVRDPDKSPYCMALRPDTSKMYTIAKGEESVGGWSESWNHGRVLPVRGRETARRLDLTLNHMGAYLIRPIGDHKVSVDLKSPLASLDWLMLDSCIASGDINLASLARYLQSCFPKEDIKIAKDCANVLGKYYLEIEAELIDAIGLPRICVPKDLKSQINGYLPVQDSNPIREALAETPHVAGYTGISSYVAKLMVRTAIVMHLRGGHIAHQSTRTSMFSPADLIYSMLKAPKHSDAEYLRPMILISRLSDVRDTQEIVKVIPEEEDQGEADILGSLPDDLFG